MSLVDDALQRAGVDIPFERLRSEERARIISLLGAAQGNNLTVEKVKDHIYNLKLAAEQELTEIKDVPQNWISLLALFIPILGIMRKWYQDQRVLSLQARLRSYTLIYNIFAAPKVAQRQLEDELGNLASTIKRDRSSFRGGE